MRCSRSGFGCFISLALRKIVAYTGDQTNPPLERPSRQLALAFLNLLNGVCVSITFLACIASLTHCTCRCCNVMFSERPRGGADRGTRDGLQHLRCVPSEHTPKEAMQKLPEREHTTHSVACERIWGPRSNIAVFPTLSWMLGYIHRNYSWVVLLTSWYV